MQMDFDKRTQSAPRGKTIYCWRVAHATSDGTPFTYDKDFKRIRTMVKGVQIEAPFPRRPMTLRGSS